jgi:type II secretory pathway pseudopilin PulG
MKTKEGGFSLPELAVIVLILGLLTTLSWRFVGARLQQRETVAARSLLERADWALTGFVLSNHRLPCPAGNASGIEDCGSGEVGKLPFKTLGMADARAGTIRYGVLRRAAGAPDPEAATEDPQPPLCRNADLAAKPPGDPPCNPPSYGPTHDRFYPLVGWIWDSFPPSDLPSLPVLTTKDTEVKDREFKPVFAANVVLGKVNGIDFCQALRVAEDPVPTTGITDHVHVTAGGAARQVAYALALPGALDASGDNAPFDGTLGLAFDPPQGAQTHSNDDRIRAVSPGVLWNRLGCGEAVAAIGHAQPNAATAAAMLYLALYDYEQVLEQALKLAEANITIASSGVVGAVGSIIDTVSAGLHAAGDTAKTAGGLAPTSIGAAVLMGVAAATVTVSAALSLTTAVEVRDMTKQRYEFLMVLRASAKPFAEEVATHVSTADAKGLYLGQ